MPVFVEDPSQFSKERLKSELIAHNVDLPPPESKKHAYVELYLKHVTTNSTDFSSDEEEDHLNASVSLAAVEVSLFIFLPCFDSQDVWRLSDRFVGFPKLFPYPHVSLQQFDARWRD